MLDDLDYQTAVLINELKHFRDQLLSAARPNRIATPSQILADLLALENEFDPVEIDLKEADALTIPTSIQGLDRIEAFIRQRSEFRL